MLLLFIPLKSYRHPTLRDKPKLRCLQRLAVLDCKDTKQFGNKKEISEIFFEIPRWGIAK